MIYSPTYRSEDDVPEYGEAMRWHRSLRSQHFDIQQHVLVALTLDDVRHRTTLAGRLQHCGVIHVSFVFEMKTFIIFCKNTKKNCFHFKL